MKKILSQILIFGSILLPQIAFGATSDVPGIRDLLLSFLKWLLGIAGIVAIISFVVGGIQYLMFSGDEKMAEMAKKTVLFSVIGIVAVLVSYILVNSIDTVLQN